MEPKTKIGIIICDRYRTCAGGKCLRAMRNRKAHLVSMPIQMWNWLGTPLAMAALEETSNIQERKVKTVLR